MDTYFTWYITYTGKVFMVSADPAVLTRQQRNWRPLIRYSHIVSSAVRDILESEPLEAAGGTGMTPRQFHLLEFIAVDGHHIDDVAKFLRVTPPAATKAVDKLEKRGLVVRCACAGDRRLTVLMCSEEGVRFVARYRALQQETLAAAMSEFGEDEISGLAGLLERYSRALIAAETRVNGPCLRCSGWSDRDCPLRFTQRGCAYAQEDET
ncbi:MAG: MarR family winged helix-turn-helix transcriptional regulator [Thermoanaerobaculia bacterium]